MTTARRGAAPTIVEFPEGEPVGGRAICDDPAPVPKAALGRRPGGLAPHAMPRIDATLEIVLDLH